MKPSNATQVLRASVSSTSVDTRPRSAASTTKGNELSSTMSAPCCAPTSMRGRRRQTSLTKVTTPV